MMEVYAAALTYAENQMGRILEAIEDLGQTDNTLVIFIQGDNSASAEGGFNGLLNEMSFFNGIPEDFNQVLNRIDELGSQPGLYLLTGESDLPAAREVQKGFHLLPLKVFQAKGLDYDIPKMQNLATFDFKPVAPENLREFDKIGFAMKHFLSLSNDVSDPNVVSYRGIGLSVEKGFDLDSLDELTKRGLARAAVIADQMIADSFADSAKIKKGWRFTMGGGRAGHDLSSLAAFASYMYGAKVLEEILYPNCCTDAENKPFDGANKYILKFENWQAPPVSVLWNMSM